jgi:hypothetical protein
LWVLRRGEDAAVSEQRCPACLGLVEPGQQYCLQCGERLADPGPPTPSPLGGGSRRPPREAWAVLCVVLLIAGLLIGWAVTSTSGTSRSAAARHTSRSGTASGATLPTTPTDSSPIATDTSQSPSGTSTAATDTSQTATDDWPSGQTGWAAILVSKDESSYTYAQFQQKKQDAQTNGLSNVGVLDSNNYSSLRPGYWVLYQGPFSSQSAATAAAQSAAQNGYPGAYPRWVAA